MALMSPTRAGKPALPAERARPGQQDCFTLQEAGAQSQRECGARRGWFGAEICPCSDPFVPAVPIAPRHAGTEQGSRGSCSGLKQDKNSEKWAAALAGEWGKLTEPLAAAEAIWGSSPSRTPPGAKPQIFPNNEIQPQINPHQYVDKLLVFEITSLPTMKLSHFSTSTCSSQENQILTSESWKCWFSTLHLPSRPGNADFLHNTFPSHFQSWKGTWKCWFSTLHLPFTLPGNTWEVLLHTKAISKFAAAAGFEDPSQQTWYLSCFKSFIFLLSSVNVTFPRQGTVTE